MDTIMGFINSLLGNYNLLFIFECIAISIKSYLLYNIAKISFKIKFQRILLLLLLILSGAILDDLAWIVKLAQILFIPSLSYAVSTFVVRVAWAFMPIVWQSLGLCLEYLALPKQKLGIHQKLFLIISTTTVILFLKSIVFNFHVTSISDRPFLDFALIKFCSYYCPIVILPSLFIALKKLCSTSLPRIIKRQLQIFLQTIIAPLLATSVYHTIKNSYIGKTLTPGYVFTTIYTMLMTYAIYYCTRKIIQLRFLNLHEHVHDTQKLNMVENFKEILDQLTNISSKHELINLTKAFFKQAFKVPMGRTHVFLRATGNDTEPMLEQKLIPSQVEQFITQEESHTGALTYMCNKKILIYDELEFTNFYEEKDEISILLKFMKNINADLFAPIYDHSKIIGYIVIERDSRIDELYSDSERDEIIVFASFASNIINLLQNHKIETILSYQQQLNEELYQKHQEINQYKESIKSFLNQAEQKKIGILFYKNRKFLFGNQDAKELIKINPSIQEGHPTAKALKKLVKSVQSYQTTQQCFTYTNKGKRLILMAIPNLESNNIIITAYYPDISDVIQKQLNNLKDPSEWDYLLYLETTNAGQLINQAIPGTSKLLLNAKIKILKCALSKKVWLLKGPDDDLLETVELLHHINMRSTLHILKLESVQATASLTIKLFGINPLFGSNIGQPLFDKLNNNGTLFIKNIHLMELETQKHLAHYIKYGFYRPYKSEQHIKSDIHIICSTQQSLRKLVQEHKFLPELYNELKESSLKLPSLLDLTEDELGELADTFASQAIRNDSIKKILVLSDREKAKLASKKVVSLQEFKTYVQKLLESKSKKNNIEETAFDPAYQLIDPALTKAARLGKHALRDPQIMAMLWEKFKNQNKIATFLGVNRSSINRRCKKYNLY